MKELNKYCLCIVLIICHIIAFSQQKDRTTDSKIFSPDELKLDLYQLRAVLENVHPGLYRFENKEIWDARFDSINNILNKPLTDIQFYRMLVPLIAKVRCGHTNISVSSNYNNNVFSGSKNFPFMVKVINGKLYTYHNLSDENNVPDGSELLDINGQTVKEIIDIFYNSVSADGYIQSARYQTLGKYFSYYYATLIGYPEIFEMKFIKPGENKISKVSVRSKTDMEKGSLHWEKYDSKVPQTLLNNSPLAFIINKKKDYALLKIDRFFTRGDEPKDLYEKTYDSLFISISKKNISNLIIDLRNNGGGTDKLTSLLYSYLANEPFKWNKRMHVKNLYYHGYTKEYTYNEYQYAQDESGDIWVTNGDELFMPQQISSPSFKGNIYVLVNGLTFSASSTLAAYIKSQQRGLIIGEESGGYSNGVTGGRTVSFNLKYTGIYISIPPLQTYFELDTPNENRGVIPDEIINPNIMDLINSNDVILNSVINKIKS